MPEKRKCRFTINLTKAEFEEVLSSSQKAGLSLSEFGRRTALAMKVESNESHNDIVELLKMNGDLKRLGGLLKLAISQGHNKGSLISVLHKLDLTLAALQDKIEKL